ncbi:hypothetical protein BJY04DRAFT_116001 [Aspergillus karnatakaensis]|uniref:uncharacterized protein n=1 Tax=Aspergillus karnatakaensis TaxID=1810916 RepID=UPI003CCD6AB3
MKPGVTSYTLLLDDTSGLNRTLENISDLLQLIDPRLVPSMLLERFSLGKGLLSAFAFWKSRLKSTASRTSQSKRQDDQLHILLDFAALTGYRFLELFDGSGNTPIHKAVGLVPQETLT